MDQSGENWTESRDIVKRRRSPSSSHSPSPFRSISREKRSRKKSKKHHRESRSRSRSYRSKTRSRSRSRSPSCYRRTRYYGTRENPFKSRVVGIFGLNSNTNEAKLMEVFEPYGTVERVSIIHDAKTGNSRGFGFVYYARVDHASRARAACNGMELQDRRIRVDYSITKRAHTPTPGVYMGSRSSSDRRSNDRSRRSEDRSHRSRRSGDRNRRHRSHRRRSKDRRYRSSRRDYSGSRSRSR